MFHWGHCLSFNFLNYVIFLNRIQSLMFIYGYRYNLLHIKYFKLKFVCKLLTLSRYNYVHKLLSSEDDEN